MGLRFNLEKALALAKVPNELWESCKASVQQSVKDQSSIIKKQLVRFFFAGWIARQIPWEGERLLDYRPDKAWMDIAYAYNITANGDNGPWVIHNGVPQSRGSFWLDPDPESKEYRHAVSQCYWSPGNHPRSYKARKAWYRRNACEQEANSNGAALDLNLKLEQWHSDGDEPVSVYRLGDVWQVTAKRRVIGKLCVTTYRGYELSNVFTPSGEQSWWFFDGATPMANVCAVSIPSWES